MRDLATTLLDGIGLLALAAGIGAGSSEWIGWWGMALAGMVVLAGSALAHKRTGPPSGGDA